MTQLHYYVSVEARAREPYRRLLLLHPDEQSLMLTDSQDGYYRAWIRLPGGRTFGKHSRSVAEAIETLITKLERTA